MKPLPLIATSSERLVLPSTPLAKFVPESAATALTRVG